MTKTIFIHGFATNITHFFRKKPFTNKTLFPSLFRVCDESLISVFRWGKSRHFNLFSTFNPLAILSLYFEEKVLASDENLIDKLHRQIVQEEPNIIITHSMGAYIWLNYLHHHNLPPSVKEIIFMQADIHSKTVLPKNLKKAIEKNQVKMTNYYCYWDEMLWVSYLVNGYRPAGLIGLKKKGVKNQMFSLTFEMEKLFMHNSVLKSPRASRVLIRHLKN